MNIGQLPKGSVTLTWFEPQTMIETPSRCRPVPSTVIAWLPAVPTELKDTVRVGPQPLPTVEAEQMFSWAVADVTARMPDCDSSCHRAVCSLHGGGEVMHWVNEIMNQ